MKIIRKEKEQLENELRSIEGNMWRTVDVTNGEALHYRNGEASERAHIN